MATCIYVRTLQYAIKMSYDSCSLFTLQPSFLLLEMCLLLVIEDLGLSLPPHIKLLNRGGERVQQYFTQVQSLQLQEVALLNSVARLASVRAE